MEPEAFYAAANLNGNPFRSNPVHGDDPRMGIWVGYEAQRRQMMKFLTRSRSDQVGNINFVMLYGQWGTGKSHALLWAVNEILNVHRDEFDSVAYYVPTLKKEKGTLTFAGAFRDDVVDKSSFLNDLWEYRTYLQSTIFRYQDEHPETKKMTPDEVLRLLFPSVDLYSFAVEIQHADSIPALRNVVIPDKMSDYQAMLAFTRTVNLFVHEVRLESGNRRFKKAAYLMIDEMDDLVRASAKEARDINDIIRHIYDACPNCFGIVIALSAEVADLASIFYEYLLERIQKRIYLDLMDRDTAVRFVHEILRENRLDPNGPDEFDPFDEEAVISIVGHLNRITPRKIIDVMQQALEEVRLAGLDPASARADEHFLEQHDIIEEVLGDVA